MPPTRGRATPPTCCPGSAREGSASAEAAWITATLSSTGWRVLRAAVTSLPHGPPARPRSPVAALGAAGHVLDFDDTYLPGLAHLSAPTAPAALALGAELGCTGGEVLDAYAAGFEAMGAFAAAVHPTLYDRGWHPTAVCGSLGAAVAAGKLLGLADDALRSGAALGLLRAGGLRAAFGSAGKSLQVGLAAAAGVEAARLAAAGASVPFERAANGFNAAFGAPAGRSLAGAGAIEQNWIKPWPVLPAVAWSDRSGRSRATGGRAGERPRAPRVAAGRELRRRERRPPGQVLDSVPHGLHGAPRPARRGRLPRSWTRRPAGSRPGSRSAPTRRCSSPRPF